MPECQHRATPVEDACLSLLGGTLLIIKELQALKPTETQTMEKWKKVHQFSQGRQRVTQTESPDPSFPDSLRQEIWTTLELFNFAFEAPGSELQGWMEVTDVLASVA
jgi:hypothetical protein